MGVVDGINLLSVSQSVSLVLSKLRIRYKGDHKCRLAANTGLTLLPLNLAVLHITRTFLSTSWEVRFCAPAHTRRVRGMRLGAMQHAGSNFYDAGGAVCA